MAVLTRREYEAFVDTIAASYDGMAWPSAARHYEQVTAIYADAPADAGPMAKQEIAHQAGLIAVLYWRLAQAKGFIPVSDDGSIPAGPGYPPFFEPTLESD